MIKERQLIQTKVDKELYIEFKTHKDYFSKSIREMFEEWMRFELLNRNRDWIMNPSDLSKREVA